MELHERIEKARNHAKLARKQLGDRINPPVKYQTVRTWELPPGHPESTEPRLSKFSQIADITGVRLAWLLLGEGPMLPSDAEIIPADVLAAALRALPTQERAKVIADAFGNTDPEPR